MFENSVWILNRKKNRLHVLVEKLPNFIRTYFFFKKYVYILTYRNNPSHSPMVFLFFLSVGRFWSSQEHVKQTRCAKEMQPQFMHAQAEYRVTETSTSTSFERPFLRESWK